MIYKNVYGGFDGGILSAEELSYRSKILLERTVTTITQHVHSRKFDKVAFL